MRNALDVRSAMQLRRYIVENNIEIVHAHLARDYPLAAFATRGFNDVRLILTRHLLVPIKNIHRLTLRNVHKIIAVSNAVADVLRQQQIVPDEKIEVIHNGVDIRRFTNAINEQTSAALRAKYDIKMPLIVGVVGELAEHKGQEDFLIATSHIARLRSDVGFLIVGKDNSPRQQFRFNLENIVAQYNLTSFVRFADWVESVETIYSALDVFVSPSRVEPFGLVMVEAMASATPVIATNTTGAREIIVHDSNGLIIEIGDAENMAREITRLLDDASLRARLSGKALEDVQNKFALELMVEKTEAIYLEPQDT